MNVIQTSNFQGILRRKGHVTAGNLLIKKFTLFGWFRPSPAATVTRNSVSLSLYLRRDLHSIRKHSFRRHDTLFSPQCTRSHCAECQISSHSWLGRSRRRNYLLLGQPFFIVLSQVSSRTMSGPINRFFTCGSPKKSRTGGGGGGSDKNGDGGDDKLNPKHVTRAQLWQKEKEKYLTMPIDDKRKMYKCKDRFLTLDDVLTWPKYAEENDIQPARKSRILFPYNAEINEKVSIWRGDITRLEIDSISNAANSSLLGGGGVDGAIHSAAGRSLVHENETLNGCDCGDAKISGGYKLPAKYIISTVGPMGHNEQRLRSCYTRCLKVMLANQLRSLALPCISTGIYGYPNEDAAVVAMETVRKFLEKHGDKVDRIIFCLFLEKDVNIYSDFMPQYFPIESEKEGELDQVEGDAEEQYQAEGGSQPKQETGTEPKQETGMDPKQETGTEPKQETGTEPKQETGMEPKQETGTDPKQETGTEPKSETGVEPKQETGTESKPEQGMKSQSERGTEPKPETGTEPMQEMETEPIQETGMEPMQTEPKPETGTEPKKEKSADDTKKAKVSTKAKPKAATESKCEVGKEAKL